jgi:hypothetical protein
LHNGSWNSHRRAIAPLLNHGPHGKSNLCVSTLFLHFATNQRLHQVCRLGPGGLSWQDLEG